MDSQLAVILLTGYRENRPGGSTRPAYCSESVPLQFGGKREPNIREGVPDRVRFEGHPPLQARRLS